jgi:hypothetical protein
MAEIGATLAPVDYGFCWCRSTVTNVPLLFFAVQRRSAEFLLLFCFMKGAGFHGQTGLLQFFFCNNRFTDGGCGWRTR